MEKHDHIWIYFIFHEICGGQHAYFPCLAKESKDIWNQKQGRRDFTAVNIG